VANEINPISKTEVQTELVNRQDRLESQIDHLDRFIIDLTSHKLSLENANRQIEKLALTEQDSTKRTKYFTSIRMNIELLTKVFDSIAKLETIKYNYNKEIDDVIVGKIKLIAIDIRKLDEALKGNDGDLVSFFEKLGSVMTTHRKNENNNIKTELLNTSEYKL
jgi:hypothetical protein